VVDAPPMTTYSKVHRTTLRGRNSTGTLISCLLFLALFPATASSQTPEQLAPAQRIYLGLSRQFASSSDTILILFDPGITIDAWTDPGSDQLRTRFSQVADEGLKVQPIRAPSGMYVSSTYEQILRQGVWGQVILDNTQQQQVTTANRILYKDSTQKTPTAGYALYIQLKDRYSKAQAIWDSTPEDRRTETMRADLDAASRDLDLRGNAAQYQSALEILDAVAGTQPSTLRDRWIAQLEGSTSVTSGGTRSFPADLTPPLTFDYSSRWTTVTLDSAPPDQSVTALPWPEHYAGIWRFCNSSAFADGDDHQTTSATSAAITLETKALAISRPWIDEALFSYRGWKTKDPTILLASGEDPMTGHASGALPIIVTHIILARNVAIDGRFSQTERSKVLNQDRAGKCTSYGPFVLTGKTDLGNSVVPMFPFGGGFYLPGTQVIAVVAKAVAKSPNPDPTHYKWP
jgi:hypothetical protein